MKIKNIILASAIVFVIIIGFLLYYHTQVDRIFPDPVEKKCTKYDGRIVNTISGDSCFNNETNIGKLRDMRCQCVCCVDNSIYAKK